MPRKPHDQRRRRASKKGSNARRTQGRGWRNRLWPILFRLGLVAGVLLAVLTIYLDAVVREKFEGKRWSVPAQVYARPLEIFEGKRLTAEGLETELRALGYEQLRDAPRAGSWFRRNNRFEISVRGFRFSDSADPPSWVTFALSANQVVGLADRTGQPVPIVRLDPVLIGGIYPAHKEDRILVTNEELPPFLRTTLIATEDRHFEDHFGISVTGILRALVVNLRSGRVVQGGSTLTQQLVKNFYLSSERTLTRKAREAIMAILLELHYSKDEILEAYINEVYLGQAGSRAIHGFGMASQFYFGAPLGSLTLEKVALLVAMVKGPTYYNPRRHAERAMTRRNLVLDLLVSEGGVSADEAEQAKKLPLGVTPKPAYAETRYPAFMDLVKRQLQRDYRNSDLQTEGLRIFTTIDPIVQTQAESSLQETLAALESAGANARRDNLEGAVVVTSVESGEVIALVGGREARFQGLNRALDMQRQIGSIVKPAVFLTALERPGDYTLATLLEGKPLTVEMPNGMVWEPGNFDGEYPDPVPLYESLSRSLNVPTARLGMDLGIQQVLRTMNRLGVEQDFPLYPSLLLGAVELSPLEVVQMYQTIAASGYSIPVRSIRAVTDPASRALSSYPLSIRRVVDQDTMYLLHYAMKQTMREGTGRSAYRRLPRSMVIAGKTGTTNDYRDSWFAGFSGDYLAVAWVGRDDNQTTGLTGGSGALAIWIDLMAHIATRSLASPQPPGIEHHFVDTATGLLATRACEQGRSIPFIEGSEPQSGDCGNVFWEQQNRSGENRVKSWLRRWLD